MTARSERPMSREISCVRPPMRPLTDSRSERVLVDAGSIAYSAVTQPSPEPLRHRGTPSDAEAAQSTRVRPNSTSTEPAAWSSQLRVIVIGRSSSSARPSARAAGVVIPATLSAARRSPVHRPATSAELLHLGPEDPPQAQRERDPEPDEAGHDQPRPLGPRHVGELEQPVLGRA